MPKQTPSKAELIELLRTDVAEFNRLRPDGVLDITDADFSGDNLSGVNLTDADLSGANLSGANLSDADLSYTDLTNANIRNADLRNANLIRANLGGATVNNDTVLPHLLNCKKVSQMVRDLYVARLDAITS